MTLVTSGAWIPEAEERRSIRDDVRARFKDRVGILPFNSMTSLSLSPQEQHSEVLNLISKANPQHSEDVASSLNSLSMQLVECGLGLGGPMASVGDTALNFDDLVPQELLRWHFAGEDSDG
ncbi:hypothetical protein [Agrobacterium sp. lyk4-40-TYG-31]|uniref:hypothetical protein n=1 Tax=Agrobacterium sp. lyk4-40-TYG-31 TaxID=3040276 RepID=UPI00254ABFCF|nr:hypothetical protein [Agrobacterium sp. lyk4-40-TYG-31]